MFHSARRHLALALAAVLGMLTFVMATSGPAAAATASRVTAKPAATSVWFKYADSASGYVSPGVSGRLVALQRLSGSRWVDVYAVKTASRGAYKLPIPTDRVGTVTYRTKAVGSSRYATAYSPSFKVTTRAWVVKDVTGSNCKKLGPSHWRLDVYTRFTNGRALTLKGMEFYGMVYIGQLSWSGQNVDYNWAYTGRCA